MNPNNQASTKAMRASSTITEENYLKSIFKYSPNGEPVSTNTLAAELKTSPASVTDMIKKMNEKKLIQYTPYRGVSLSESGKKMALTIVRRHRLWEVFLNKKLNFTWDEVHDSAEHLEHVNSAELINRLQKYLDNPTFDPHGDPIPDEKGDLVIVNSLRLSGLPIGKKGKITAVTYHDSDFLIYLKKIGLVIGAEVTVLDKIRYKNSREIEVLGKQMIVSNDVVDNILVD